MEVRRTLRGFEKLVHEKYASNPTEECPLAQTSSIIRDYENPFNRPSTSALWIGEDHHLNRAEVSEFIQRLQSWLSTGSLEIEDKTDGR